MSIEVGPLMIKGVYFKAGTLWRLSVPILGLQQENISCLSCLHHLQKFLLAHLHSPYQIKVFDRGNIYILAHHHEELLALIAERIRSGAVRDSDLPRLSTDLIIPGVI
jgi:hypothetical protein